MEASHKTHRPHMKVGKDEEKKKTCKHAVASRIRNPPGKAVYIRSDFRTFWSGKMSIITRQLHTVILVENNVLRWQMSR